MSRDSLAARLLVCFVLLCTGAFAFGLLSALEHGFHSDKAFAQDLIRLHVIANSNLPQDQELKLKVRDAVLLETKRILGGYHREGTGLHTPAAQYPGTRALCAGGGLGQRV